MKLGMSVDSMAIEKLSLLSMAPRMVGYNSSSILIIISEQAERLISVSLIIGNVPLSTQLDYNCTDRGIQLNQ